MTKSRLIKIFIKKCQERGVPEEPQFYTCKLHKIYNEQDYIKVTQKSIEYVNGFMVVCYKLRPEEYNNLKKYF